MKIKFFPLLIILCIVLCACNNHNQATEPGTTDPVSNTTQPENTTTPTEDPTEPTFPENYQDQEFPLDVFDEPQNTTDPKPATEPDETEPATEPVTEPLETDPITEPVTEPPATTLPGSGIELPEVPL